MFGPAPGWLATLFLQEMGLLPVSCCVSAHEYQVENSDLFHILLGCVGGWVGGWDGLVGLVEGRVDVVPVQACRYVDPMVLEGCRGCRV